MADERLNQYLDIAQHRVEVALDDLKNGHNSLARRHLEKLCSILCWGNFNDDSPTSIIIDDEHRKAKVHFSDK